MTVPLARSGAAAGLLLLTALLVGCSSASSAGATDDAGTTVPSGDPAYAFAAMRHEEGEYGVVPVDLEEALPNHLVRWRGPMFAHETEPIAFSDVVVVGRVTKVVTGCGVIWRDENDFTVVDFDDADADTRTVHVTVSADETAGADVGGREATFRLLVPSGADPRTFAEGLAGLGRIAVVLEDDPSHADAVPWRPILNDRLIGVVAADGSLHFPALPRVVGPSFADDIRTADQMLAAARGPVTTTTHRAS